MKNHWGSTGEFDGKRSLRNKFIVGKVREFTLSNQRCQDIFMAGAIKRTEQPAPLNKCGQEVLNQLAK